MKHVPYKCPPYCEGCMYCDGGLIACIKCGGAEGSLPTECPGHLMTAEQQDQVYSGDLDYRDGKWTDRGD